MFRISAIENSRQRKDKQIKSVLCRHSFDRQNILMRLEYQMKKPELKKKHDSYRLKYLSFPIYIFATVSENIRKKQKVTNIKKKSKNGSEL